MAMKGYVMDIQPFSVNDGDGIRTTVFLAGCPLRCKWCSNPEGFSCKPLVGWHRRKCIGCGECEKVCPEGIGIDMGPAGPGGREKCTACGRCVSACPVGARTFMVSEMDADEIIEKITKHRLFFQQSGGGVTFSGGEATYQSELLAYLTDQLYDMGYSLDIETSGMFDFDELAPTLEKMDLIFMDLKMMDDEKHAVYTGVSNRVILENIRNLGRLGQGGMEAGEQKIVIRIPVIGGVNDDDENIRRSAAFVHEALPDARMELLPYHEFGRIKYEALGMEYPGDGPGAAADADADADGSGGFTRPSKERMEELRGIVRGEGVEIADFI